jgi:hypothetical protein
MKNPNQNNTKIIGLGSPLQMLLGEPTCTAPTLYPSKSIKSTRLETQIIDFFGDPLVGVNVRVLGTQKGGITDQNGYIVLSDVSSIDTVVISHIGKESITRTFGSLGSLITMQEKAIENTPVILTVQQKANKTLMYGAIGAGVLFTFMYLFTREKPKKKSKAAKTALI